MCTNDDDDDKNYAKSMTRIRTNSKRNPPNQQEKHRRMNRYWTII